MSEQAQEEKVVWIKCRASEGCEGNQAVIVFSRAHSTVQGGGFIPAAGGRMTRYRCLTCGKSFHVTS